MTETVRMPPTPAAETTGGDISRWILQHALKSDDGRPLIAGVGEALNRAGLPACRVIVGLATLNTGHRGITFTWTRGEGITVERMEHGAADDLDFDRSPIGVLLSEKRYHDRWRIERGDGCDRFPLFPELRRQGCTDYVLDLVGFPTGTALRGVGLAYVADRPGGFTEADLATIAEHRDALALATLRISISRALRNLLEAYVGERTAGRVMAGQVRRGAGEPMAAAILLADLKQFTSLADRADPLRLVGWLDEHLDALGRDVERHGGEILKFTGDGFIAVFPVREADVLPCAACAGALAAAQAELEHNRRLVEQRTASGEPTLAADLALHFGEVVYGNIGTASRLDFTAIGRAVNEASRIEALCDVTGRNLLLSDSFARRCREHLVDLGTFSLRGVEAPQRVWTVPDGVGGLVPDRIDRARPNGSGD